MKKVSKNKQIIIGNNLKVEAIVPITINEDGEGYKIVDENKYTSEQLGLIISSYKEICSRRRTEVLRKDVSIKRGGKTYKYIKMVKTRTLSGKSPCGLRPKDIKMRTSVNEMIMIKHNFKYTIKLLDYMKDNFKNMFTKETKITQVYEICFKEKKQVRRKRHRIVLEYPALSINESLKTFLIASPVEKWIRYVSIIGSITEIENATYLRDQVIIELKEFFEQDKENAMEWDEYADKEVKRLWSVTNDYKVPSTKMSK